MAKEFKCPGIDLEYLVRGLNEIVFPVAFLKPDRQSIETRLRSEGDPVFDYPPNLAQTVDQEYTQAQQRYEAYELEREKFLEYFGINPEEVSFKDKVELRLRALGVLKKHVENHGECRRAYDKFLRSEVDLIYPGIVDESKNDLKMKEVDKRYLGLFVD
jgi:hypothetical protein